MNLFGILLLSSALAGGRGADPKPNTPREYHITVYSAGVKVREFPRATNPLSYGYDCWTFTNKASDRTVSVINGTLILESLEPASEPKPTPSFTAPRVGQ